VAGEDGFEVFVAEVDAYDLGEDIAEIGGVEEVATFVELVGGEAGPIVGNDFAFFTVCVCGVGFVGFSDGSAEEEHAVRPTVVGTVGPVFGCGASEVGEGDQ